MGKVYFPPFLPKSMIPLTFLHFSQAGVPGLMPPFPLPGLCIAYFTYA